MSQGQQEHQVIREEAARDIEKHISDSRHRIDAASDSLKKTNQDCLRNTVLHGQDSVSDANIDLIVTLLATLEVAVCELELATDHLDRYIQRWRK